ncbi:AAA family ATPase [Kitasatospora arboriphila]
MRLHRLTLTAFGPFAGTEEVDFDRLASTGLFLLRGATGAGKSSVLDAVCYALYGEVPGARRGNPLRSDHAAPGLLTEVRLDLTLGSRGWRSPAAPSSSGPSCAAPAPPRRRHRPCCASGPQTLATAPPAGGPSAAPTRRPARRSAVWSA